MNTEKNEETLAESDKILNYEDTRIKNCQPAGCGGESL